jgi:hypothetical protein
MLPTSRLPTASFAPGVPEVAESGCEVAVASGHKNVSTLFIFTALANGSEGGKLG